MPSDLLYEIGVEEIPAGAVLPALDQLEEGLRRSLEDLRLSHGEILTYGTPRRLAVLIHELQERQENRTVEVKGPPAAQGLDEQGQPTKAALGFARKQGVEPSALEVRPTAKGDFLFAVVSQQGRAAAELLPELLQRLTTSLTFPKTMRWGEGEFRFVRPVRWIVALLDAQVLDLEIGGVRAGNFTSGHRVLGQREVPVPSPAAYLETLRANGIIADHRAREQMIRAEALLKARDLGGTPVLEEQTLTEVNFLVEWPTVLVGSFDPAYLALPPEVVMTVMEGHQKYFPVRGENGQLLPHFLVVSNSGPEAHPAVLAGNERVLRPRLEDARFYLDEDMKRPLADRLEGLEQVTFLGGLGTLRDKTDRLQEHVHWLSERLDIAPRDHEAAQRAAELCKCDLITMMIGDSKLGELQGIVGGYYARHSGEPEAVAAAISEHYLPLSAEGPLPATVPGALVSLADKLDNLAAAFLLGQEPTGSADPLALRRQATGVIRILRELGWRLPLQQLLPQVFSRLPEPTDSTSTPGPASLQAFLAQRLEAAWIAEQIPYDIARALLSAPWQEVAEASARVAFLVSLRQEDPETFAQLVTLAERPARIRRPAGVPDEAPVNPKLFEHPLEGRLWELAQTVEKQVARALDQDEPDYASAVQALLPLAKLVHEFFEEVMVMVEDEKLRLNRLALMAHLDATFLRLADFLEIVQPG
ncbi:MAG: glycine--tRNA ligase subunit beta [candidate division WS1 bacterium]|nr:glycine--tRNA ligase subunit beta [candidate division WS1 bacterium]